MCQKLAAWFRLELISRSDPEFRLYSQNVESSCMLKRFNLGWNVADKWAVTFSGVCFLNLAVPGSGEAKKKTD